MGSAWSGVEFHHCPHRFFVLLLIVEITRAWFYHINIPKDVFYIQPRVSSRRL